MKFKVIVEKDESGWYIVECPALPGCISQGRTKEEALENIKEAIEGLEVAAEKERRKTEFKGEEIEVTA